MKNKVCVLLSTYNGKKFLEKQLNSLFFQTYKNFDLLIRDDGSNDDTLKILNKYKINYIKGENIGIVRSFFKLLEIALRKGYEYFLFCDQDDIWELNKIERQLLFISSKKEKLPILVHSDMKLINEKEKIISDSFFKFSDLNSKKKV